MANPVLHIKDGYFFEVPKFLYPVSHEAKSDFPLWWVRLDDDFQSLQADRVYDKFARAYASSGDPFGVPAKAELLAEYEHWKHAGTAHPNAGKPFDAYLEQEQTELVEAISTIKWAQIKSDAHAESEVVGYINDSHHKWPLAKINEYNHHLSGKVLIPQPFGEIKNLHESQSGFCISKFMILELLVAFCLVATFSWVGRRVRSGDPPKGRLWNFFESFLLFIRNDIARPVFGHKDGDKFCPLLWTIFLFILGCNLMGMVPWMGSPTGAFGVTLALAVVIMMTGMVIGSLRLKPFFIGYWLNLLPHMELPTIMSLAIKPMLFLIEIMGLFIKHAVLAIRLLANMVAGHLVLLGLMMVAVEFANSGAWYVAAPVSILASTLFSCLELFVAFLQAYVFTFLAALFLNAAFHSH
jgi:F-type H+-transporting ATPase subunit a